MDLKQREEKKFLLRCVSAVILLIFIYDLYYLYKIFFVYEVRLNHLSNSIKNITYSLRGKYSEGKKGGYFKWPKPVIKYYSFDKNSPKARSTKFESYSEIFTYDLKDFCKKIYEFEKIGNDKYYLDYASQTYYLLNNYESLPEVEIINNKQLGIPSVSDLTYLVNDFFSVGCYYASKNDSRTALLISFAPIFIINIVEASYNECNEPYYKMALMNLRNTACMNLMFIANNIAVDKEISILISKYLLYLVKKEPSLLKNLEFTRARINNEFSKKGNGYRNADHFLDNVCNSKVWNDTLSYIYDGASEAIKEIESGKDSYCLYAWQNNIERILAEGKNFTQKDYIFKLINWQRNCIIWVIANYPQTFFIDFYTLYQRREEYLAITEGTAIGLALAAYSSDKDPEKDSIYDSMPKNINELSKWMGVELPLDRMSKSTFQFYFADDYFLASSPSKNYAASEYFKYYFPYFKNKWVIHSEPTANGVYVPLPPSKPEPNKSLDKIEKLHKQIQALNALKKQLEKYDNY